MKRASDSITRRHFVTRCSGALAAAAAWLAETLHGKDGSSASHQAMGTRAGELTDHSAIIWARLTAAPRSNNEGRIIPGRAQNYKDGQVPQLPVPVAKLEGACPGTPGRVRLRYGTTADLSDVKATAWMEVTAATDFIHQFALSGLEAATNYHYE